MRQAPVAFRLEGGGEREHFSVGRRVAELFGLVVGATEDARLGGHETGERDAVRAQGVRRQLDDDAPRGHLAVRRGFLRLAQGHRHEIFVERGQRHGATSLSTACT